MLEYQLQRAQNSAAQADVFLSPMTAQHSYKAELRASGAFVRLLGDLRRDNV
jgi:hypothetical protein